MPDKTLAANGIEIWTEDFGNPADPATLLIMGAGAQGIRWPQELVDGLVDAGRHVIRYDNRDTGQSTCFDFATHPYTLDDLALDAVGVLDGYSIAAAHVVGASMGGMTVQTLMLKHRPRVRSATIIMSSPISGGGGDTTEFAMNDLPGPSEDVMARLMVPSDPRDTPEAQIERRLGVYRLLKGSAELFDAALQREVTRREVDRARDFSVSRQTTTRWQSRGPPHATVGRSCGRWRCRHSWCTARKIRSCPTPTVSRVRRPSRAPSCSLSSAGHDLPQVYMSELVARIASLEVD